MKKFLSILLALAVGFTFTFGSAASAFADPATTYTYEQAVKAVTDAYDDELESIDLAKAAALKAAKNGQEVALSNPTDSTTTDATTISAEAATKIINEAYDKAVKALNTDKKAALESLLIKANHSDYEAFVATGSGTNANPSYAPEADVEHADNHDVYGPFKTVAGFTALFTVNTAAKYVDLLEYDFDIVKANALKNIAAIDLSVYSTEIAKGESQSNFTKAQEIVSNFTKAINNIVVTDTTTYNGLKEDIAHIKAVYVEAVGTADPTGTIFTAADTDLTGTAIVGLGTLTKIAEEKIEGSVLEYAKNKALNQVTAAINDAKGTVINNANQAIFQEQLKTKPNAETIKNAEAAKATAETQYAAALEVATYLINYYDELAYFGTYTDGTYTAITGAWTVAGNNLVIGDKEASSHTKNIALTDCVSRSEKAADAKVKAEVAKNAVSITGETYTSIEKTLEKMLADIYTTGTTSRAFNTTADGLLAAEKAAVLGNDTNRTVKVNNKTYTTVYEWNATLTTKFDENKYDEVRAIIAEAKTAINEATTVDAVDAAFVAAYDKYDAVITASEHQDIFQKATGECYKAYPQYVAEFKAYVDYKGQSISATGATKLYDWTANTLKDYYAKDNYRGKFYTDCYSLADLEAMYAEAKAVVDGLKKKADLQTEAAAITAELDALTATSDRDAVEAALKKADDFNDYTTMIGSDIEVSTTLATSFAKNIAKQEAKAIYDAYVKLNAKSAITTADKADVEALRAAFDAYVKHYQSENAAEVLDTTRIDGFQEAYTVTDANVKAIEILLWRAQAAEVTKLIQVLKVDGSDPAAVKAAREAYDALSADAKAMVDDEVLAKLIVAENAVETATKFDADDAKAYVQDLAIAVRTVKSGKKVKVTVNADVQTLIDNGFTVEYKFYKSTKKGSGYKNTVNKTTNTYTNTNPVKGKNYYKAKLVVKNADGTVVATTPLTQCKYGVRTMK